MHMLTVRNMHFPKSRRYHTCAFSIACSNNFTARASVPADAISASMLSRKLRLFLVWDAETREGRLTEVKYQSSISNKDIDQKKDHDMIHEGGVSTVVKVD